MSDFQKLTAAVSKALDIITSVTNLPGVDLIPYVSTVNKILKYGQLALAAGNKVTPYVEALAVSFSSGALPSEEERVALDAKIEDMHAKIQGFNPVAEEGEEE